jgi:hypothetical protein
MAILSDQQFAATANSPAYTGASEGGASRFVHSGEGVQTGKGGTPGWLVSYKGPHERGADMSSGGVSASEAGAHRQGMLRDPAVKRDPAAVQGVWHENIGKPNAQATFDRSTVVRSKSMATSLGRRNMQDAMFHPKTLTTETLPHGMMKDSRMGGEDTAGKHYANTFFPAQR